MKRRILMAFLVLGAIGGFGSEALRACRHHRTNAAHPCAHPCEHHAPAPG